jgi:hypothetical protein
MMHIDPVLTAVCEQLVAKHGAHTVMLYGSRADGSATAESDYDVVVFAPIGNAMRDARQHNGDYLDIFVYPESVLIEPSEEFLHLRQSQVLLQRGNEGDTFLEQLDILFQQGPAPLPPDEITARITWIHKMLARMQRGDAEGNYRRIWLLFSLLEDYFQLRRQWYQGPRKSLALLQRSEPEMHAKFVSALEPGASPEAIHALGNAVVDGVSVANNIAG